MKTMTRRTSQQGFTISELMIASTITLIFAGSFYALVSGLQNQMAQQNVYFDTNRAARHAMDKISKDVKEAINIEPSHGGNVTGDTVLILKLPSISLSTGVPIPTDLSSEYDYVTYKLDNTDPTHLVRALDVDPASQREGGVDKTANPLPVVARRVQSIQFTSGGAGLSAYNAAALQDLENVHIDITAQGTTVGKTQTTQVDSDVMLRNKIG